MAKLTAIQQLQEIVQQQTENTNAFMEAAQKMVQSDHEKVDIMYNFLFVGKPEAEPPVPPFVSLVKDNGNAISEFKQSATKLVWILVGLLFTGGGALVVAIYNHLILAGITIK